MTVCLSPFMASFQKSHCVNNILDVRGAHMHLKNKIDYICKVARSPKAYVWYSVVGLATTITLAILETRELCKKEAAKTLEEKSEETKLDRAIEVASSYPGTALAAAITCKCIIGIDKRWGEIETSYADALIFTQDRLQKYRAAAPGLVAAELVHGFSKKPPDEGLEWFCLKDMTPYGDIYFQSTQLDVLSAEYRLNKIFADKGTASVREFAILLKIPDEIDEKSDCYGWNMEEYYEWGDFPWIDFGHNSVTDPETGITINELHPIWGPMPGDEITFAYGYLTYPGEFIEEL